MEKEIQAAVIGAVAGLAGVIIGGGIMWLITRSTNKMQKQIAEENVRAQERTMLDGLVVKMLEFLMEHPHLEKAEFCGSYPNVTGHPNGKERYEAYCIFVFNFLMRAFKHFGEDSVKLGDYIGLEEIMKCHHKWWFHDMENYGYDEPFRRCIQTVFDKLKKEGKIT